MKKKVLATSWHPGGINTIVPVIKKLVDDDKFDLVVIGHDEYLFGYLKKAPPEIAEPDTTRRILWNVVMKQLAFAGGVSDDSLVFRMMRNWGQKNVPVTTMIRLLEHLISNETCRRDVYVHLASIEVRRVGSTDILRRAGITFRTIEDYDLFDVSLESMTELLLIEKPDLVLTGTSTQDKETKDVIEQTIVLAARNLGIKSLSVLDFWGNYWERFSDTELCGRPEQRFKYLPDKVAIMDKYAGNEMLAEEFPPDRFVITGNPYFDEHPRRAQNFTPADKEAVKKRLGLTADFLVFYAANVWEQEKEKYGFWDIDNIQLICEVMESESRPDAGLVIKLHPRVPSGDSSAVDAFIGGKKNVWRVSGDVDAKELILASDVTLTPLSTLGAEAVYMRRPSASLQPGLRVPDIMISRFGVVPAGFTAEDCKDIVRRALADEHYRRQMLEKASFFQTDGRATERLLKLIGEMINT